MTHRAVAEEEDFAPGEALRVGRHGIGQVHHDRALQQHVDHGVHGIVALFETRLELDLELFGALLGQMLDGRHEQVRSAWEVVKLSATRARLPSVWRS